MPGLRASTKCSRFHRHAVLCRDDCARDRSRLRLPPVKPEETVINNEITVVLTGRNVEKPDLYRPHVTDRLSRVERYDRHVTRYEVELDHEENPRQAKTCQHVAITGRTYGRTVRAEADGPDFHTAIDAAVGRLEERLRRTDDRRRVRHDRRSRTATAGVRA
jgi:ribosomal subunit interface protein